MTYNLTETEKEDGKRIYALFKRIPNLDLNSCYAYILIADQFNDASVVAKDPETNEVVGAITGFISTKHERTLFVWQVGVSPDHRGQGLAKKMLNHLYELNKDNIDFVHTTISDDNIASQKLFESFTNQQNTQLQKKEYILESDFEGDSHEAEPLYVIGPIS